MTEHCSAFARRTFAGWGDRIFVATSEEYCVMLWAFGGASTIEAAGYVPLPEEGELA